MWEDPEVSLWWQREFTEGVDPEYTDQILPLIAGALDGFERVLDVGTGEGQVARMLQAQGSQVVGTDPFAAQVDEADKRGGGAHYLLAEAAASPFADGSFDAVVACLVFEHISDVDSAIAEVARVLRPGGKFLFLLNHPLLQTPILAGLMTIWLIRPSSIGALVLILLSATPLKRCTRMCSSSSFTGHYLAI